MAENRVGQRSSGAQYTWMWMLLSLVLVGGFMVWLAVSSEPTSVTIVEADGYGDEDVGVEESIQLTELIANPSRYRDEPVRVSMPVTITVGDQTFLTQSPDGAPFLVKLGDALVQQGLQLQRGDYVSAMGIVHPMRDSVLAAWKSSGAITAQQEADVLFATTYFEVQSIRLETRRGFED